MFLGDLTLFTQPSVPQCCPISCMTHWTADLWICMWRRWISCNYRQSSEIKPAPADCMSHCKSTGTWLHYPLCSGNSDSIENPPPLPQSPTLHIAHISALFLHYVCSFIKTYCGEELSIVCTCILSCGEEVVACSLSLQTVMHRHRNCCKMHYYLGLHHTVTAKHKCSIPSFTGWLSTLY